MVPADEDAAIKKTIPVVCAVIEQGPAILAALRGPDQSNAGLWEFPGGKVRQGETTEAALLRELQEELMLNEVSILTPLTPCRHAYPWITIELIPFLCVLTKGEPCPREHAAIRWVRLDEAATLAWAPADLPVLAEYGRLKQDRRSP